MPRFVLLEENDDNTITITTNMGGQEDKFILPTNFDEVTAVFGAKPEYAQLVHETFNEMVHIPSDTSELPEQTLPQFGPHNVTLQIFEDTQKVLSAMRESIESYGSVSIADFYDLVGMPHSAEYSYWGWRILGYVEIASCDNCNGLHVLFPPIERLVT